jgi:hypothetical protein
LLPLAYQQIALYLGPSNNPEPYGMFSKDHSMIGKQEYIILNYLYQFYDFYRGVSIPDTLYELAPAEESIDHTLDHLLEKGLVEPSDSDLYIITHSGKKLFEDLEKQKKEEEQHVKNLVWFPATDVQYIYKDYPHTKKKASMALWIAITAAALALATMVFFVL